jgi:hypothetical protein
MTPIPNPLPRPPKPPPPPPPKPSKAYDAMWHANFETHGYARSYRVVDLQALRQLLGPITPRVLFATPRPAAPPRLSAFCPPAKTPTLPTVARWADALGVDISASPAPGSGADASPLAAPMRDG